MKSRRTKRVSPLTGKPYPRCSRGKCDKAVYANGKCWQHNTGDVSARITNYLSSGGLFNPELMEHQKVRDLLIDAREAITKSDSDE